MTGDGARIGDDRWGEFPNTVLCFDDGAAIDLNEPVTGATRATLAGLGLERPFGVVTAQDPCGKTQPPDVNAGLAAKLRAELTARRVAFVPLDACSPDHTHCERSLAVPLPRDEVVAIARAYDQLAIFWYDGDRFWIVPAAADTPAMPLPRPTAPSEPR